MTFTALLIMLFSESNPVCVCVPFLSGVLSGWFAPFREHSCMCVCHSPLGSIRVVCVIPRVFLRVCVIPPPRAFLRVCVSVCAISIPLWVLSGLVCVIPRAFLLVCVEREPQNDSDGSHSTAATGATAQPQQEPQHHSHAVSAVSHSASLSTTLVSTFIH